MNAMPTADQLAATSNSSYLSSTILKTKCKNGAIEMNEFTMGNCKLGLYISSIFSSLLA